MLRNSAKNPLKFDEILQNLLSSLKIRKKSPKKWCEGLKNQRNLEWCKGKKCRARKMLKNAALVAKIGVDKDENEPRKGSKKCMLYRTPLVIHNRSPSGKSYQNRVVPRFGEDESRKSTFKSDRTNIFFTGTKVSRRTRPTTSNIN